LLFNCLTCGIECFTFFATCLHTHTVHLRCALPQVGPLRTCRSRLGPVARPRVGANCGAVLRVVQRREPCQAVEQPPRRRRRRLQPGAADQKLHAVVTTAPRRRPNDMTFIFGSPFFYNFLMPCSAFGSCWSPLPVAGRWFSLSVLSELQMPYTRSIRLPELRIQCSSLLAPKTNFAYYNYLILNSDGCPQEFHLI